MNGETIYTRIQELANAFGPFYQAEVRSHFQKYDFGGGWYWLLYLRMRQPEGATLEDITRFNVYLSQERNQNQLHELVEKGHVRNGNGQYRLTERGQEAIEGFFAAARTGLSHLEPLNPAAMTRLAELLHRVVRQTAAAAFPIPKETLAASRWSDAGTDQPAAVWVDQYSTDLRHFRDDAHEAAWHHLGVSGFAWNTLTILWRHGPHTHAALLERTATNGVTNYMPYLNELIERDWVALQEESYHITEQGRAVREQAEADTNRHYELGWSVLDEAEQQEAIELMAAVRDDLELRYKLNVWQNINGAMAAAAPLHQPQTGPAFNEYGLNKPGYFFQLWSALGLEPEPVSAEAIRKQFPYTNPDVYHGHYAPMVEDGFLVASDTPGAYCLTEKGRAAILGIDNLFVEVMAQIEFLPDEEMARLSALVNRLSDASAAAEQPTEKFALHRNRQVHRGRDIAAMQIDEGLDDLAAFRDDVHVTAFLPLGVSGQAWETLTLLWRDGLSTPAALAERLQSRQWGEEGYAAALAELAARGWVANGMAGYTITESGREVREKIEAKTNEVFFAPWSTLNEAELRELDQLVTRLRERITTLLPAQS